MSNATCPDGGDDRRFELRGGCQPADEDFWVKVFFKGTGMINQETLCRAANTNQAVFDLMMETRFIPLLESTPERFQVNGVPDKLNITNKEGRGVIYDILSPLLAPLFPHLEGIRKVDVVRRFCTHVFTVYRDKKPRRNPESLTGKPRLMSPSKKGKTDDIVMINPLYATLRILEYKPEGDEDFDDVPHVSLFVRDITTPTLATGAVNIKDVDWKMLLEVIRPKNEKMFLDLGRGDKVLVYHYGSTKPGGGVDVRVSNNVTLREALRLAREFDVKNGWHWHMCCSVVACVT